MHEAPPHGPGYSTLAIALHWLIAALVLANLAGGFLASDLLGSPLPADRALGLRLIRLHQSFGLAILLLSLLRLGLRLVEGFPPLPAHMTPTERRLARGTHWGFHLLLLAIPFAGWAMVSARPGELPTLWFGLLAWPRLPTGTDPGLATAAGEAHEALAIGAILLVALHVAGALKHQLLDRDDVLARMLPVLRRAP